MALLFIIVWVVFALSFLLFAIPSKQGRYSPPPTPKAPPAPKKPNE